MERHTQKRAARAQLFVVLALCATVLAQAGLASALPALAAGAAAAAAVLCGAAAAGMAQGGAGGTCTSKEHFMDEQHTDTERKTEVPAPAPSAPATPLSTLTAETITKRLLGAEDAVAELKAQVGDIATRKAAALGESQPDEQQKVQTRPQAPTELELWYARMLEEAGLFDKDIELPQTTAVLLHRSHLFYLRVMQPRVPFGTKLALVRIEAALNALLFTTGFHKDDAPLTERECFRTNQSVARSITSQVPTISDKLPTIDEPFSDGEWAVRKGIATELESFRLPYRLEAGYRVNMHEGRVLFELEATPATCFPRSAWVDGLGRVVPTTQFMRAREASQYALRVGLLLAAGAFRCSPAVKDVFISAMETTGTKRSCLYTVHFDRNRFALLDMEEVSDPWAVFASFDAHMDALSEALNPIPQELSLSDVRFCPAFRYEPVATSKRRIFGASAKALGCDHVSGLAINEDTARIQAAEKIGRNLGTTAEEAVHAILSVTKDMEDEGVQDAAKRTMGHIIDGSLDPSDALSIEDDFISGDALTRAVERAEGLARKQQYSDAAAILRDALRDYEGTHRLADTETSVHRFFRSYCDRALFNRLMANEGQKTILVPDAYYQARLMLAQAALAGGEAEEARRQSASMMVLAPMDTSAYLLHAQAQTALGDLEGAKETLILLLEHAYDPETLGNAYAALAQIFEQIGDEMASAASWRRCTRFVSSSYLMAVMNLNSLSQKEPTEMAKMETDEDVDYVLASHNVPAAPTEGVSEAFVLAMRAAFDAEVFPVAKNFVDVLAMLSGDDVVLDISRSLEGEPDR